MITKKKLPYFIFTLVLFILLKFSYTQANNDALRFLLLPTDQLVGLLTGSNSTYTSEIGYYHESINIVIEKSCSGYNFWLLNFLMLTYLLLKYPLFRQKVWVIPTSLVLAYLLTLFANTSRIFVSIVLQRHTDQFFLQGHDTIHEAIGIITNLSFLILVYYLSEKTLIKKQTDAQLA